LLLKRVKDSPAYCVAADSTERSTLPRKHWQHTHYHDTAHRK